MYSYVCPLLNPVSQILCEIAGVLLIGDAIQVEGLPPMTNGKYTLCG